MVRRPGHATGSGRDWVAKIRTADRAARDATLARDELVRQALADGLGVRGAALALGLDKTTITRRYGKGASR